jgi:hypothetical protein
MDRTYWFIIHTYNKVLLKSIGKYALVDTNTLDQILHKGVKKITFDKHNIKKYKF